MKLIGVCSFMWSRFVNVQIIFSSVLMMITTSLCRVCNAALILPTLGPALVATCAVLHMTKQKRLHI